jgi:hypothetical protein
MKKEKRSNKWAFLIYQESTPEDYLERLEELHIPFILSPWHDRDVNSTTGEFKNHINTVLCFLNRSKATHKYPTSFQRN